MGDRMKNKQQNRTTGPLLWQIFLAFSFGEKCHSANYVKCSSNWLAQTICRNLTGLGGLNFIEAFAELATQLPPPSPWSPVGWVVFFHGFIWKQMLHKLISNIT